MKKQLITLTALSYLIFGFNAANAKAPTAELTVKGQVSPPGCIVMAPDGGVYNVGEIAGHTLKPSALTVLPSITKNWSVICDAETYVSVTGSDNRAGSSTSGGRYGLGFVNGAGKIGDYGVYFSNAKVDGTAKYFRKQEEAAAAILSLSIGPLNGLSWVHANATKAPGKVFSADIEVMPRLGSVADMKGPITENVKIDGSMTLSIIIGI
ncbi:TPA: DUF1120 domain-containing protein [Yersinia enterocolitica]|uniref:DUF1120 domain-containing protein n=1 Tax=Yersinia enterocolitica TaxID=630 RepID=UPI0021E931D2|nr:DUF1120 domain-containing protein [Yersinia enterocolitica]EKN3946097.1 DUF1120 domain-containing protein [Yersinia enterocolitica]EKN5909166.1 DUF1120 domain-containing protein [Yersinia enterocolitica]EKN6315662.1 DUF1120 domain-containing protein [Yersinia enterocolitica]MCY1687581.1 DUF1120 domain-containing protein [Yersinia enterocolitica]UYJ95702.1 DUF1120 domain-containing protein [Yersinia enterocolitica]